MPFQFPQVVQVRVVRYSAMRHNDFLVDDRRQGEPTEDIFEKANYFRRMVLE